MAPLKEHFLVLCLQGVNSLEEGVDAKPKDFLASPKELVLLMLVRGGMVVQWGWESCFSRSGPGTLPSAV